MSIKVDYFVYRQKKLPYTILPFSGRSDYGSFIDPEMLAILDPAVVIKVIIKVQKSLQKAYKISDHFQSSPSPVPVQPLF